MRIPWLLTLVFVVLASNCQRHFIKQEHLTTASHWPAALQVAKHQLPTEGRLVQQADGYAYVKVDDRYINELFPLLQAAGYEKPPYFRRSDAPGAHISVFYEDEHLVATEAGQVFHFVPKDIVVVKTNKNTSYIVLVVYAPELEILRKKYGLAPKLNHHEFHITIAKKQGHS